MSLVVTPGYTWVNGEVETATKLNLAATPTIADGQAGVFSTGSFSGTISSSAVGALFTRTGASTSQQYMRMANTTGSFLYGVESSAGGALVTGSTAYDSVIAAEAVGLSVGVGGTLAGRFSSTGLAVTGALSATGFLSSGGYKYQTADLASVSGTPADLSGLTLSLVSGNTYSIRGVVYANGGGGSLSPTLLVHGSGGLVASYVVVSITALTSNGTTTTPDMSISFAMEASKGTNPTAGSTSIFMVEVTITVGTSGTFSLQGSRSGSGTATFYKGSFLQATLY